MFLPARPPFSFHEVVHSHGWMQLAPYDYDETTHSLSAVLQLASGRVTRFAATGTGGGILLDLDQTLPDAEQAEMRATAAWIFALDSDFSAFYEMARQEPALAHVQPRALGRVLRSPSLFEDVVKTILTTNTQWGGTRRMNANLVAHYGSPLPSNPALRAFPTPASIAGLDELALRSEIRLGYRSPYVLALSRKIASGEIEIENLRSSDLPTVELRKRLLALPGIGPYAAANLLLILGRTDFIPIDSWALSNVSRAFHDGQPIGPAQVEAAFERWGAWKGLVFWFWDWQRSA